MYQLLGVVHSTNLETSPLDESALPKMVLVLKFRYKTV